MESKYRKNFIKELAPVLLNQLLQVKDRDKVTALAELALNQLRSGHLLVYSNDSHLQTLLEEEHLAGQVEPGQADFLMLVDSNLSFSKADMFIERNLNYDLDLSNIAAPQAVVSFSYENRGTGTEPCNALHEIHSNDYYFSRCYWDYWRLYMAPGVKLIDTTFEPVPDSFYKDEFRWKNGIDTQTGEGGAQVFGALNVVPQQQKREVVLKVALPQNVIQTDTDGSLHYRLRVQKQPGIDGVSISMKVHSPTGYQLSTSSLKNAVVEGGDISWQGFITRSGELELTFKPQKKE
jgi:hypothetical protein